MSEPLSFVAPLLRLAWPVVLARLGIMGMGLVDVVVVGQLAPRELSHQALGWTPTTVLLVTAIGLLTGVQVLAARAIGEGQPQQAGAAWRRGMVVAAAAGGLAVFCMWLCGEQLFSVFGIAPALARSSARVMRVLALSVPLHLFYVATAFFLEAIQRPMASTIVMWAANGLNLGLNLLLVPRHGALGSAWATFGARLFLAAALALYVLFMREARHYGTRRRARAADLRAHAEPRASTYAALLQVGVAAALSQAAEAGAFSGMTIIAGRMGERAVAAYQILLNLLAVVFMIALGLSTATAVLASEAVGRGAARDAMRASFTGLLLNTGLMLLSGLALLVFANAIGHAYTADQTLAGLCIALFPFAAAIMLPDGGQVVVAAALRAQGDNWFPTGSHVLAYALVMPVLGFWLAERLAGGVTGLLLAILTASLLSVSVLIARLGLLSRRGARR